MIQTSLFTFTIRSRIKKSWLSLQFFSLFFFRILVFFFEKLRNKSTLSTNPKRKLKNSLIQPRTSRSNFGKISLNFEKIGPGGGPEALRYGWILRKHLKKPQLWTHEKIFDILNIFLKVKNNTRKTHEIFFDFFLKRHILRLSGGVSCWHLPTIFKTITYNFSKRLEKRLSISAKV